MTTIKLKNGSGAPTAGDLVQGEPALDLTNKRLYTEDSGGTVIEVGTNPGTDVTFADNRKAIFGAGSDLQIYHDGNHSYVSDQGTGSLRIQATDLGLETAAGNQNYLTGVTGGAVTLFHNGSTKLATTSTGIDVTGTTVTDGLTSVGDAAITGGSSGSTVLTLTSNALADTPLIVFQRDGGAVAGKLAYEDTNTAMAFGTTTAHELKFLTSNTERMQIDSSGNLLVGTTSSLAPFTLNKSNADWLAHITNTNADPRGLGIFHSTDSNSTSNWFLYCEGGGTTKRFAVRSNGGIANYQANDVNLSDERVKTDITPLGSMWEKFKAIEIVSFKYKDQTHDDNNIGVIAQQVEKVAPEFVDASGFDKAPEGEEPLKAIYTADLYHATIKALQEAMDRIETLEAEVTALKGEN